MCLYSFPKKKITTNYHGNSTTIDRINSPTMRSKLEAAPSANCGLQDNNNAHHRPRPFCPWQGPRTSTYKLVSHPVLFRASNSHLRVLLPQAASASVFFHRPPLFPILAFKPPAVLLFNPSSVFLPPLPDVVRFQTNEGCAESEATRSFPWLTSEEGRIQPRFVYFESYLIICLVFRILDQ